MKYRIEWRPIGAEAPTLSLCRRFVDGEEARHGAMSIVKSQEVNEFGIALLGPDGSALKRVLTNAAAILEWDPAAQELPIECSGQWSAHVAAAGAGAHAFSMLESTLTQAWQAGKTGRRETARLIREARRLLDDEEEE